MRFAFKTAPQNTTWRDMLAVWQEADDIELFESGWTFDHFYPILSDSAGPCLEGWVTLTALAQATSRLRLGTLVTGIHYRHPAVLANMAATLDIVSGGRLELGIGAGWNEEESGAYGIELGGPAERSDRFEEACEVIVSRGERRTLRTTARFAQHWNFVGGPPEEFARKRDVLHAHCRDIGRDPAEIVLSSHVRLGPDGEIGPAADTAAALGDLGLDLAIVVLPPPHAPAVLAPLADALATLGYTRDGP